MVTVQIQKPVKGAGSTLHINKSDLTDVLIGQTTAAELCGSGRTSSGGIQNLRQETLAVPDDFGPAFEILPLFKT
jgi:hypothetical protein